MEIFTTLQDIFLLSAYLIVAIKTPNKLAILFEAKTFTGEIPLKSKIGT